MTKQGVCAIVVAVAMLGAHAGTCTYSFGWFKNNAVNDFAVPVHLVEGENGFSHTDAAADGSDLRVYDTDDALLPHEIESWNATGRSLVWVKVPAFSTNTVLTLKWGSDAAGVDPSAASVWGDETTAVFHFASTATVNSVSGATFNSDGDGTAVSDETTPLGNAAVFSGASSRRRNLSTPPEKFDGFTNNFTISMWLKPADYTTKIYLFQMGRGIAQKAILLNFTGSAGACLYGYNDMYTGTSPYNASYGVTLAKDNAWHHFAVVKTEGKLSWYVDGHLTEKSIDFDFKDWRDYTDGQKAVMGEVTLGGNSGTNECFIGMMDELRFETVARDADYLRAAAETQYYGLEVVNPIAYDFADLPADMTLTNFTAFVALDTDYAGYLSLNLPYALNTGGASVFSKETGDPLPYEVEYLLDTDYAQVAGLWVTFPEFTRNSGVRITTGAASYYRPDNPSGDPLISTDPVWDPSIYAAVFHMNPTGRLFDAVSKQKLTPRYSRWNVNGTTIDNYDNHYRGVAPPATGPTGPYAAMRSTTNAVQRNASFAVSIPLTNVWTISWWSRVDAEEFAHPKQNNYVWSVFGKAILSGQGFAGNGCGPNKYVMYGNGNGKAALDVPDAGWHHYVYSCDGTTTRSYRDGVCLNTSTGHASIGYVSDTNGYMQLASSGNAAREALQGAMDEFRIENVCRDTAWIAACYRTQLAYRDGVAWQLHPHFSGVPAVAPAWDSAELSAVFSCRTNATVTLYWGATDGGTHETRWQQASTLGVCADGTVSGTVTGLAPDQRFYARFRAVNDFGEVWSEPVQTRIPRKRAGRHMTISVNYSGTETLTNFPLCVLIPASRGLPADASRVRFMLKDGSHDPLAWEAATWNPSGESVVWVRVPELTADTRIEAFWHDDLAESGNWNPGDVWTAEYGRVFHFDALSSSVPYLTDSSANAGNMAECVGLPEMTNGVSGAACFRAEDAAFSLIQDDSVGAPGNDYRDGFTFSFWTRPVAGTSGSNSQIVVREDLRDPRPAGFGRQYWFKYFPEEKYYHLEVYQQIEPVGMSLGTTGSSTLLKGLSKIPAPEDDAWHQYVFTHDGLFFKTYCDGACVTNVFWPFVLNEGSLCSSNIRTSFFSNSGSDCFAGSIDEYRAERTGRSPEWIKACYDNQKETSTFVTVGPVLGDGTVFSVR